MKPHANSKIEIISVGWEPFLISELLGPVEKATDISFIHALVGDASRLSAVQDEYPDLRFISLSKKRGQHLPEPNVALLASLESVGVQTVRSMIQGDPYLRYLPEKRALGYATLIAVRLKTIFNEYQPNIVLASHDRLHSAMALAVAKSLGIPFVALAFPVIPETLTGFCKALTPNSLVPIVRSVDDDLRHEAISVIRNVRMRQYKVVAYQAPFSALAYTRKLLTHVNNFIKRVKGDDKDGLDEFSAPPLQGRLRDILRRTFNRICLPTRYLLTSPPAKPYLYYPFHMAPESMVDTWAPFYQNQLAFVAQIAHAMPIDVAFVVKLHFSDPDNYSPQQLKELMSLPGLRIAHPSAPGRVFLDQAALVIGITGTSCLEAALLGKPVLVFGDSPYVNFPRSERAERPDRLYGQICRMLDQPAPTDNEIVDAYASYMARFMPGRVNDWGRGFAEDELQRLIECFTALGRYVNEADNRLNWYQTEPFLAQTNSIQRNR